MANRLTKIVTRTGDTGTTGLGDGTRVPKGSPRIEVIGEVDELNSTIGVILAGEVPEKLREMLFRIQHDLFDFGGEMCMPGHAMLQEEHVLRLEEWIQTLNSTLSPLKEFILPGGTPAAAAAHLARAVSRRTERRLDQLAACDEGVSQNARKYINRLSDFLFVLARCINQESGRGDVLWQNPKRDRA